MKRFVDIALNLIGIMPDRPTAKIEAEYRDKTQSRPTCYHCRHWSGLSGDKPYHLMCAVNVPRPTEYELHAVSCILAYAYHDCLDFEAESQLE